MTAEKRIILASASPRRRELLAQIGVEFEVRVSGREEIYYSTVPEEIVEELALAKAENVLEELRKELLEKQARKGNVTGKTRTEKADADIADTVVIGADTVVVLDGRILGKPKDKADAEAMLAELQGRAHDVYTGVAVLSFDGRGEKSVYSHAVQTKVYVHEMSGKEIRDYVSTGDPLDKAGAYGIQGSFAAFVDRIDGDYYNVVGLPVSYIYQILKKTAV